MNRKLIIHICVFTALLCVAGIIWFGLGEAAREPTQQEIEIAIDEGRTEFDQISGKEKIVDWEYEGIDATSKILVGIVLLVVVAGYGGIVFVAYLLPAVVHRFTHMFYGSEEQAEVDPMHDARALFAQGDFDGAIEAYRAVAAEQPENRFPWIEISKIQHDNLEDPDAAIATLREALESFEWRVNDAAFLMFRLAEMYEVDKEDQATAIGILHQVVETFPDTRHSANATHRLRELGAL